MSRAASLPIFLEERGGRAFQDQIYRSHPPGILDGLAACDGGSPSTRALATDLAVSRTTALLALDQLRAEGYLVSRRGSGMFIASALPEHRPAPVSRSRTLYHARRFPGAAICCRPCVRRIGGSPASPACAFRLGTPALDLFPHRIWAQLTRECLRALKPSHARLFATGGFARIAHGHRRTGAGAWHPLRSGPGAGRDRGATRPRSPSRTCCSIPATKRGWKIPGYTGARGALAAASATVISVPVDAGGMVVERAQTPGARLAYVTPSCQFPLGVAMSLERRHDCSNGRAARGHGSWKTTTTAISAIAPAAAMPARARSRRAGDLSRHVQQDRCFPRCDSDS